jgi:hypothetical protein
MVSKMNKFFLLVVCLGIGYLLSGQDQLGDIKIIQDSRVDTLVQLHKKLNERNPLIDGWRINIFFETGNNSKKLAMEAKARFVQSYTNVPSYLVFQEPYYKVLVGDYRTKMEAEKFLKQIMSEYSNAFLVEDKINLPDLEWR